MADDVMRTFSFDGNTLEQIHAWMQQGHGLDGVQPAIEALNGLSKDLEHSMDSLRDALTRIGAWSGSAGEHAMNSTLRSGEWVVVTTPQVDEGAQNADQVATGFVSTRARMPSPGEAELSVGERSVLSSVPLIGPMLDQQKADEKRDRVTNEARQRMRDWQDEAQAAVGAVQPLPAVPTPTVDVAAPQPAYTAVGRGPVHTGQAGLPSVSPAPPQPLGQAPSTGGSAFPGVPPSQLITPQEPLPGNGPRFVAATPPIAPGPSAAPLPATGRPVGGGVPLLPLPVGGSSDDGTAGRRRAYGPGAFNAEEVARSRGGGAVRSGVLGVPDEGRPGGRLGAAPEAEQAAQRRAGVQGARGGGSFMQPAVGGVHREEDGEHTDKYAEKSDEYFVGEPHRVAPPVIGG